MKYKSYFIYCILAYTALKLLIHIFVYSYSIPLLRCVCIRCEIVRYCCLKHKHFATLAIIFAKHMYTPGSKVLEHLLIQGFFFYFLPRLCKAVIKTNGGYLKNLKYILFCLTLFGYSIIPCVLIHSLDVLTSILQCRK